MEWVRSTEPPTRTSPGRSRSRSCLNQWRPTQDDSLASTVKRLVWRGLDLDLPPGVTEFEVPPGARIAAGGPVPGPTPGQSSPANVAVLPHSMVGKLFFMVGTSPGYCTAQLIGDDDIVLTAAHCVRDKNNGTFYSKFSFIPGYRDGTDRFSAVSCVGTWSTFHSPPNYAVDYAFGKLKSPLKGGLGLKSGLPATEWISVGYPFNATMGAGEEPA